MSVPHSLQKGSFLIGWEEGNGSAQRGQSVIYDCLAVPMETGINTRNVSACVCAIICTLLTVITYFLFSYNLHNENTFILLRTSYEQMQLHALYQINGILYES